MKINIELYNDLRSCAGDTVNQIRDDSEFCEAEFELFREWFKAKGFSEFDARYVEACGYDLDLFYEDYEEGR